MHDETLLERELRDPEFRRAYQQEKLISEATAVICEAMRDAEISRSTLARWLGRSRGFITQILSGSRNLTLRTLADVMTAVGSEVVLSTRRISAPLLKSEVWSGKTEMVAHGTFEHEDAAPTDTARAVGLASEEMAA